MTPLRAIIWSAVSTKAQTEDGKDSLESQIEQATGVCNEKGWQIVDVLEVPGHSRRYFDIHRLANDAMKEGITAFHDMLAHWERADFDILIARDGDRFARTQTLHALFFERTISIGAKVFTLSDGFVDADNMRMNIAMGGYRAAGEVDNLTKRREQGYKARAKRGLPVNSRVVGSHKPIRDAKSGKMIGIEVDESRRQEFEDLAELVLEGVPFASLEDEMYKRFGYVGKKGKPYFPHYYSRILYTPSFWGHLSRNTKGDRQVNPHGTWSREQGHPVPNGISIQYNVIPPAYTGKLANEVKAELTRREAINGRRKPNKSYKFSGLMVCGLCGRNMVYATKKNYIALRCNTRWVRSEPNKTCESKKHMNEKVAIEDVKALLDLAKNQGGLQFLTDDAQDSTNYESVLASIQEQIKAVQGEIRAMIVQQSKAADNLQDMYNESIADAGNRLEILEARQTTIENEAINTSSTRRQQRHAMKKLEAYGDTFWEQSNNAINQELYEILGEFRFVCSEGRVIGITKPV